MTFTTVQKTAFRQRIEAYFEPSKLRELVEQRKARGLAGEIEAQKDAKISRMKNYNPIFTVEREGGRDYLLSKTIFGRHFDLLTNVREMYGIFQRPFRIFLAGAGLVPFEHMPVPFRDYAREMGINAVGMSYEAAEMALIAGHGGEVTAVEIDPLVVGAMNATLFEQVIVNAGQPFGLPSALITPNDLRDDVKIVELHEKWQHYLMEFSALTALGQEIYAVVNQNAEPMGISFKLKPEIAQRVTIQNADVGTVPIEGEYNWAWLMNLGMYVEDPIWWSFLVRMIKSLKICEDGCDLGHLTVNDIIKGNGSCATQVELREHATYFFEELAGMKIVGGHLPPMERDRPPLFTAMRIKDSSWLDEQYERIKESGLS